MDDVSKQEGIVEHWSEWGTRLKSTQALLQRKMKICPEWIEKVTESRNLPVHGQKGVQQQLLLCRFIFIYICSDINKFWQAMWGEIRPAIGIKLHALHVDCCINKKSLKKENRNKLCITFENRTLCFYNMLSMKIINILSNACTILSVASRLGEKRR